MLIFAFPGALRLDLGDSESLDDATSGRVDLMEGGVDLAREQPLLGWGSGSFNAEYRRTEDASGREATSASHTIPITVAAEQGILGLAAYVALLVLAFLRLLRGARGVTRCGRRSPPASPRSCCTPGSTPPSSRTR